MPEVPDAFVKMLFTTFATLINLSLIALAVARPTPLNGETVDAVCGQNSISAQRTYSYAQSPNRRDIENSMSAQRDFLAPY